MSVNIEEVFEGFDTAEIVERLPDLPPMCRAVVALKSVELEESDEVGVYMALGFEVVESNNPDAVVGITYGKRINGLNKAKKKKLQWGRVRQFLGGLHNVPASDETQKWTQILSMLVKSPEKRKGWLFLVETGRETKTEDEKYTYIPVQFGPAPKDHPAMPAAQAKVFA